MGREYLRARTQTRNTRDDEGRGLPMVGTGKRRDGLKGVGCLRNRQYCLASWAQSITLSTGLMSKDRKEKSSRRR
jgi:hypothetical protein